MGGRDGAARNRQVCVLDDDARSTTSPTPPSRCPGRGGPARSDASSLWEAHLGPLLLFGDVVAVRGRSEAAPAPVSESRRMHNALGRDGELLKRRVLGGLADASDHRVLVLELARLGRDDAEHDRLRAITAFRQSAERLKIARALRVSVFSKLTEHAPVVVKFLRRQRRGTQDSARGSTCRRSGR